MTNDKSEIYSKWYKKNKDSLNEKKAQRYKEDKEYREKIKERARERSRFLAAQNKKAIKGKSGPIPPKEYTIRINGTAFKVKMYTIGSIAKILKREIQTVRQWERKGLIPAAMY